MTLTCQSVNFLGDNAVTYVDSIADLRLLKPSVNGEVVVTSGTNHIGDGNGSMYVWSDTATGSDDGVKIILSQYSGSSGRWLIINSNVGTSKSVRDFGAIGDGSADDSVAFKVASEYPNIYIPAGTYYLGSDVASDNANFIPLPGSKLTGPGVLYCDINLSLISQSAMGMDNALQIINQGKPLVVSCYGDSLTYGQDTSGWGTGAPINGSTTPRTPNPFPETLLNNLSFINPNGNFNVNNRGYPGDNTLQGLSRWNQQPASDVVTIMYGTNDIGNYGGLGVIDIKHFTRNISLMIYREIGKGATSVILISPPKAQNQVTSGPIEPYREAMANIANKYGFVHIDWAEQVLPVTNYYVDGIHQVPNSYVEFGWNLTALFANREISIAPGQIFYPDDHLGVRPIDTDFNLGEPTTPSHNRLIKLMPGEIYCFGAYVTSETCPEITVVNTSTGDIPTLNAYYGRCPGMNDFPNPSSGMLNDPSNGITQSFTAVQLKKGYRFLVLRNDSTTNIPVYIESVRFKPFGEITVSYGSKRKLMGLTNSYYCPPLDSTTPAYYFEADFSSFIMAPGAYTALIQSDPTGNNGIAMFSDPMFGNAEFPANGVLWVYRLNQALVISHPADGVADTTIDNVFTTNVETHAWTIYINNPSSGNITYDFYLDNVKQGSFTSPYTYRFPGFLISKSSTNFVLKSAYVQGDGKYCYTYN